MFYVFEHETDGVSVDDDDGGVLFRPDVDVQGVVTVYLDDLAHKPAYGHDLGADREAVHHFLLLLLSLFLRDDGEDYHADENHADDEPEAASKVELYIFSPFPQIRGYF